MCMRMLTLMLSSMRQKSNFTPMEFPDVFLDDCALVYEIHQRYVFSVECERYFMLVELEKAASKFAYFTFQNSLERFKAMRLYNMKKDSIPHFIKRREDLFKTLESKRLVRCMEVAREVDIWISKEMFPAAQSLSLDDD
jgi:hypothetical protein